MGCFRRTGITVAALLTAFMLAGGCSSDRITQPDPNSPSVPTAENPPNGALDYPAAVSFEWDCSDPLGDSLTFDFYLSNGHHLQKVASGLKAPDYRISTLRPSTEYHWRVVAHSRSGRSTRSPTWRFETWEHPVIPVVAGARWRYQVEVAEFNVRGATGPAAIPDTILRISVHTVGPQFRDASGNWAHAGTVVDSTYDPLVYVSQSSFVAANTETGYYLIAGKTAPATPAAEAGYRFRGERYATLLDVQQWLRELVVNTRPGVRAADDLLGYAPDLVYPPEVGREWVVSGQIGSGVIKKRISGRETVELGGHSVECTVVEWSFDLDADGLWDEDIEIREYYSTEGLVYTVAVVRDVRKTTYEDPYGNQSGTYDVSFKHVATEVFIPELP